MILSRKLSEVSGYSFAYESIEVSTCTIITRHLNEYISYDIIDPLSTPLFIIRGEEVTLLTDGESYEEIVLFYGDLINILFFEQHLFNKDAIVKLIKKHLSKAIN